MNVPGDDVEKIGFRDPEQRRAKPSGRRGIELVGVMAATDEDRVILMFPRRGGCDEVFKTPLKTAPSSPTRSSVSRGLTSARAPQILLFSKNLQAHWVKHGRGF